ncbi:outer membrane protein assembly factor BamC [Thiomicrorhabdus sp. 6S2-11]|uniref:Outer membrane protein assembly factor BamC n=1 Tax=Thiomicrorhabdus marina TaxID=2818442 RepID=A0ABS3Q180_9GAMM|nr:outer membrane protein assembly factor BamC [Thiomicrorhabdus marina]MBO1926070.1 outer membrane protein assembly factor BamC [Thiomicrorhabdus marina]
MRFAKKTVLASTLAMTFGTLGLSGCSTLNNMFGSDDSYRDTETKTVKNLEMPPNLFNPGKADSQFAPALQDAQNALAKQQASDTIPTFQANGLAIKADLSNRWLELKTINSEDAWRGIQRYFTNAGFQIAEARKDIGIIKTDYLPREEVAPTSKEDGPLTRLFNSWRPELAKGAYDKFIARVETDKAAGVTRVYINHNEMVAPGDRNENLNDGNWYVRPYSPVLEAQALYQAMVFFGSSSEQALAQLESTQNMVETIDGEEFNGLKFKAGMDESWSYLQAMVYRAGWNVHTASKGNGTMQVDIPEDIREQEGILSSLAFWRDRSKTDLPQRVVLKLAAEDDGTTIFTASALEGEEPLTALQRKYLSESLGLLAK